MKIALAGNPNSGKTTLFNLITGKSERVGNWSGVTVEQKEGRLKKAFNPTDEEVTIVDLPGAYSISPFTQEEKVTSDYVKKGKIDVIINVVDSTNLSRSLFLTTQLLEMKIPVVLVLNKADVYKKKHTKIDEIKLSQMLNCPVVETVSVSEIGVKEAIKTAIGQVGKEQEFVVIESDEKRFEYVNKIVGEVEFRQILTKDLNRQDKFDSIITKSIVGIPLFALVMFLVFGISQAWVGPWIADMFTGWLDKGIEVIALQLQNESGELGIWASILVDGILGGVVAVVGFLPLVMVMYFLISLLEDCGYMARASVVLDPIFKKVGLSGKSIIPFVVGTGCAIPGVMACRTIRDDRERRATAMLTPFMPCGAKLPVIALFSGVFFRDSAWVGVTMYFLGIIIILLCALLINKITGRAKKTNYFIIELPEYKTPDFWLACKAMLSRGWAYVVKAGTIILVCNFVIHVMQTFNWSFQVVEASESILHDVATPFAYVIAPVVGVVAWQLAASTITGFIAKENVVGTLAICYGITNFIDVEQLILQSGATEVATIFGITKVAGLAFLALNLFSPPCFAAIGAMNAELKDKKWFFAGILLQIAVGFTVGFLIYFFGTLFAIGNFGSLWMPLLGWAFVIAFALVIVILITKKERKLQ